jgi:hypothetical protein
MSKGLIVFLAVCALSVGYVVYAYKGNDIKFGSDPVVETVEFSVIRYEEEIVSSRLIIDGTGKLKSKHFLSEEKLGVAYYKKAATIRQIQSCTTSRYILDRDGFTQEVIKKEIQLE